MRSFIHWSQNNRNHLLSYLIVFIIMVTVFAIVGFYPFGDLSILKSDLFHGYAPMLNEIRMKILSSESLLYSWRGGLGGDFIFPLLNNNFSPFILLALLFPTTHITELFLLLLLIKIPFSAATCSYFLERKFGKNTLGIGFSVMYALCSFVTAYYWNFMWIEGVIMLPLVAVGIEKIVNSESELFYIITLAIAIMTNYLMGLFICFFSVVYYFTLNINNNDLNFFRSIKNSIVKYTCGSLVAALLSSVVLVGVYLSLRNSAYLNTPFPKEWELYFSPLRFLSSHFFALRPGVLVANKVVPNVFTGILTLLCAVLFMVSNHIRIKEKITYVAVLIIFYMFFSVNVLDFIINGFHFTQMLPHRFAFIYSFILVLMSYKVFIEIKDTKIKTILLSGFFIITLLIASYFLYPQFEIRPKTARFTIEIVLANLLLIFIYTAFMFLYSKNKIKEFTKKILNIILIGIICVEFIISTYMNFTFDGNQKRADYYRNYADAVMMSAILDNEEPFYRAEFKHGNMHGESKIMGYKGLNAFAQLSKQSTDLIAMLGVTASNNKVTFSNPTPLVNSIFSLKYLFNRDFLMQPTFTLFEHIDTLNSIALYENPHVLPIGFMTDNSILEWEGGRYENPFFTQNDLCSHFIDEELNIFSEPLEVVDFNHTHMTLRQINDYKYPYELDEDIGNVIPVIEISYLAETDDYTYIYVAAGSISWANVYVDGKRVLGQMMDTPNFATLDAGFVNAGSTITVELTMMLKNPYADSDDAEEYIRFGTFIHYSTQMNYEMYTAFVDVFKKEPFDVAYFDETIVAGNITVQYPGIMYTSIPYDDRWSVYVNGEEAQKQRILNDALIGIPLDPGEYEIIFIYEFRGLWVGFIITFVTISAMIGWYYFKYLKREEN